MIIGVRVWDGKLLVYLIVVTNCYVLVVGVWFDEVCKFELILTGDLFQLLTLIERVRMISHY